MDGSNAGRQISPDQAAKVRDTIALIKTHMPKTYRAIQEKAKVIGDEAFGLVRRGIRGESGCFYAFEAGHVVGTPFSGHQIEAEVAKYMVTLGCSYVCIWPGCDRLEASHGTN